MMHLLAVAAGGAIGAVSRYALTAWVDGIAGKSLPWGTLAVNVLGSFLIGVLLVVFASRTDSELARQLLITGFLGSLTTFSTFSMQTVSLLQQGALSRALINVLLSVALCITATWLGILAARPS